MSLICVQANLAVQESGLNVANNELGTAEAQLADKQTEFDKVKAKCDAAMKEKQVWFNLMTHFLYLLCDRNCSAVSFKILCFSGLVG